MLANVLGSLLIPSELENDRLCYTFGLRVKGDPWTERAHVWQTTTEYECLHFWHLRPRFECRRDLRGLDLSLTDGIHEPSLPAQS